MNALIALSITSIVVLFSGLYGKIKWAYAFGITGILIAFYFLSINWSITESFYNQMITFDNKSNTFSILILFALFIVLGLAMLQKQKIEHLPEIISLLIFATCGGIIMVSYSNLVMLFLGIEILSIPLYILAASNRYDVTSSEAGIKYFIMGAFASAIIVMGISFIYGTTGTFNLKAIYSLLYETKHADSLFYAGLILTTIGFTFKLAAVPFHFWAPDVYEGSPSYATAFMATVVKIAGFAALLRFSSAFPYYIHHEWTITLYIIIISTLLFSNIVALSQTGFKRLIAYSGISNTGFLLLAILAYSHLSYAVVFYYLTAYTISTLTLFAIYIRLTNQSNQTDFEIFNGLSKRNPLMAIALFVSLLSLSGIPPLMGFFGKYLLFLNTINFGMISISVFAILTSVVAVYYYLRMANYSLKPVENSEDQIKISVGITLFLLISIILNIFLGIFPSFIYQLMV